MLGKAQTTTPEWPIAFARLGVPADDFLATYPCNHTHGVYGDWVEELLVVASVLGIEARVYR
jgi:L-fucose isomerase